MRSSLRWMTDRSDRSCWCCCGRTTFLHPKTKADRKQINCAGLLASPSSRNRSHLFCTTRLHYTTTTIATVHPLSSVYISAFEPFNTLEMSGSEFGLRQRPSHPPADPDIISRAQAEHKRHPASPTLTYEESLVQVPWQTDNKYIRRGYRKRLQSYGAVGWSLIACECGRILSVKSL